ncbi:Tn3 family transposase [Mixta tenebrionis]|uniref:Tn3 family transposase n=1 Tax=Mixta tenebrionis TaxID=2562439 RepID=A0A506VD24_9GAMM|nr:Tn3 family transposase [Mixta tenebrionis]
MYHCCSPGNNWLCYASYPEQNGLAKALRGIGRIEQVLFILGWLRDRAPPRRVQAGPIAIQTDLWFCVY